MIIYILLLIPTLHTYHIVTKTNTDQIYASSRTDTIYSIQLNRVQSSHELQPNHCQPIQRTIQPITTTSIYKLSTSSQSSIYQQLTTLQDNPTMIQQFVQLPNDKLFVLTTQSQALLIDHTSIKQIKINVNLTNNLFILDYNNRALVVSTNELILCSQQSCDNIKYSQDVNNLFNVQLIKSSNKYYLFLFSSKSIIIYEISVNGQLSNRQQYTASYFNTQYIMMRAAELSSNNKLILLDSSVGLWQVTYNNTINIFMPNPTIIYHQKGCYKLSTDKQCQYIVMSCSLNLKSFFIMELIRNNKFNTYEPQTTIFRRQSIHDIAIHQNTIISRVFSGIRFYWASKSLAQPYPYDYLHAGDIFLHNAIQSKISKTTQKVIYVATQYQITRYQLQLVQPYITCYSNIGIQQKYVIKYKYPCENTHSICESQQQLLFSAEQHKQVKVNTMLIPFIISLIGAVMVICMVIKICIKFNHQIQSARIKYNSQNQFGIQN